MPSRAADDPHSEVPRAGRTVRSRVHLADPRGGGAWLAEIVTSIDVDADGELFELLCRGELNVARGHAPGSSPPTLAVAVLLHWPSLQHAALFVPNQLAHRALHERADLLERFARVPDLPPWFITAPLIVGRRALRVYAPGRDEPAASDREILRAELGDTRRRTLTVRDRAGRYFSTTVYASVNVDTDPDALDELLQDRLNVVVSPHDGTAAPVPVPVLVHWPAKRMLVLVVPPHLSSQRLVEHARALRDLAGCAVNLPRYAVELHSVVGAQGLTTLLRETHGQPAPEGLDGRALSGSPAFRTEGAANGGIPAPGRLRFDQDERSQLGLPPVERVGGPRTSPHETNTALHLVATAPDRFPGGVGENSWLDVSARPVPVLALRLDAAQSALWAERDIRLLVQLHNLDVYPLAALVLVAVEPDGSVASELFRCIDVGAVDERRLLQALGAHFALTVAFYATGGALQDAARFVGPLELNVRDIVERAEQRLARRTGLDWEAAVARFAAESFPRIGTMRHPFSPNSFSEIQTPGEAALAAGIVSYWSQDPNQRYLVFNQSFSRAWFEQIRERVIDACLRFGIRLQPVLRRLVAENGDQVREILARLLASFAEVQLNLRSNDLDPVALWENWRLLLEDADEFGVDVDPALSELARSALEEARDHEARQTS